MTKEMYIYTIEEKGGERRGEVTTSKMKRKEEEEDEDEDEEEARIEGRG